MSAFDRTIGLICGMTECDALTASELIAELEERDMLKAAAAARTHQEKK